MIEEYLGGEVMRSIRDRLQPGESYDDFDTMCSTIANNRVSFRGSGVMKHEAYFAAVTLCGISWPGKPPTYEEEVRRFRSSFRGISDSFTLKAHFMNRCTQNLLAVDSLSDLNFEDITSIFHPANPEDRPLAMAATASAGAFDDDEDEEEEAAGA